MSDIQQDDLDNSSETGCSWECGKGRLPRFDVVDLIFSDLGLVEKNEEHNHIRVTTHTGQTVTITDHNIQFAHGAESNHEIMKRAISLAGEQKNDWMAYGSRDFQRSAVAYGYAYGLNVTATDQAQFTAKDWAWIKHKAAEIGDIDRHHCGVATGYDLWKSNVLTIGDVPRPSFSPQYRQVGPRQT